MNQCHIVDLVSVNKAVESDNVEFMAHGMFSDLQDGIESGSSGEHLSLVVCASARRLLMESISEADRERIIKRTRRESIRMEKWLAAG